MFLGVLEAMVYTAGAIFAAIAIFVCLRLYKGQAVPFLNVFNSEASLHRDLEKAATIKMPITPDVIRT